MRRCFALIALLLAPAIMDAQSPELVGKRIRAKLAGPDGPWVHGFVMEAYGDSLTMGFSDKKTAVRLSTMDVTVHKSDGYNTGRGVARGAIIGGLATIALMASSGEFGGEGPEGLLYLVFPPIGAAIGGAIGVGTAPERWTPISTGRLSCGGWHAVSGNTAGGTLTMRGARSRKRGAIIGASLLGGIGLVAGLADPTLPRGDLPGVVIGNFVIGGVVGSFFGPRERVAIPTTCP